jgi:hypothetical protein
MTSLDLKKVSLPGVTYKFAGKIKKLVFDDGQEI